MTAQLLLLLAIILVAPFAFKKVEQNLEIFLFVMGLAAAGIAQALKPELFLHIFQNRFLYFITGAVLIASIVFKLFVKQLRRAIHTMLVFLPLPLFSFFLVLILGLISSLVSAIVTSLILVEMIQHMPITRDKKITLDVIACFAIGLGAVLTPIGEPLATIVVSLMNQNTLYLLRMLGVYVIPCIFFLAILAAFLTKKDHLRLFHEDRVVLGESKKQDIETYPEILLRTVKIFLFVIALEMLGAGFKPLINAYLINIPGQFLYWINMLSAVLDNATIAAAEISPLMSHHQITAILMGLLISGGILIPGNIPNIISSSKLNISSKEWARLGLPLGMGLLVFYYILLFIL